MITKKRMSPDVRFFYYICGVGFDFMRPCRFYRFSGTGFFISIILFRIFALNPNPKE